MNAYHLAQYLQAYANEETDYDIDYHIYASKMLILQAERIKELEAKYKQEFEYAENLLKERK
jgi:hypothetical protein|tara:strand:+ start:332 stop:517 length:186 start_codon:yes stop_codon:yes gene_type:complete